MMELNDVHSRLNATRVSEVVRPDSAHAVQVALRRARDAGLAVSIAGGRHAMGGQQFGTAGLHLDMTGLKKVLNFDHQRGLIEVEGGCLWPELMAYLHESQAGTAEPWGIRQKQTGADDLSLAGSLSANIHGRGLMLQPFIADVESFVLMNADGASQRCSRTENKELFRLAAGGYGLFGVILSVEIRLMKRLCLERLVERRLTSDLMTAFEERIRGGFLYGDFQFMTDEQSPNFLREGVFSCYRPMAPGSQPIPAQRELSMEDWHRLYHLAHTDKARAYADYLTFYLSTHGQCYASDTVQLSYYPLDYHQAIETKSGCAPGSEMITEIYVPREHLNAFMEGAREDFLQHHVDLFYGTIRLIEADQESFLTWAREPWACIIFNLHTAHDPAALAKTAADFQRLIDRAIQFGGSYYLTYHRWARRDQVEACYPQFQAFLAQKQKVDPERRFMNEWYRHYEAMFRGPE